MTTQILLLLALLHPTPGSAETTEPKRLKKHLTADSGAVVAAKPNKPGASLWRHEDTLHFEAATDDDIRTLFDSLDELRELDPRQYEKAEVTVLLHRWIGETRCAPNDPRLRKETVTYSLQGKVETDGDGSKSMQASMSSNMAALQNVDPCL